ncbi:MAG: hypothetical protein ACRDOO_16955 [Actinomadura sp.]
MWWTDAIGVAPEDLGTPKSERGVPAPGPGRARGPDPVVRPGTCRSVAGPYDPPPVRRYGRRGFPRTSARTAAPVPIGIGRVGALLVRLLGHRRTRAIEPETASRAGAATHHPGSPRSEADAHPRLLVSVS